MVNFRQAYRAHTDRHLERNWLKRLHLNSNPLFLIVTFSLFTHIFSPWFLRVPSWSFHSTGDMEAEHR